VAAREDGPRPRIRQRSPRHDHPGHGVAPDLLRHRRAAAVLRGTIRAPMNPAGARLLPIDAAVSGGETAARLPGGRSQFVRDARPLRHESGTSLHPPARD
jgi:hypothetical protein